MGATAQAFAGPPETDDRKQDGSQLDVEALLRSAMLGSGAFFNRTFDNLIGPPGAEERRFGLTSFQTRG